tara:strand:- start:631 stop:1341 length:711 start_codon:yes stop_codon:yes gene_type:complete
MNFMNFSTAIISSTVSLLAMFSLTADSKAESVYNFDSEVVMEMKEYMGTTQKSNSDMKFYASKKHSHLGYVMQITTHGQTMAAQIIMDAKDNTLTTLISQGGMKMGMQYDLGKMDVKTAGGSKDDGGAKGEMKKTGKTKTILGHKCYEYEVTNDKSYTSTWVAEDLKMASFFEAFSKMQGMGQKFGGDMPSGFPLEINSWPNGKGTDQKYVVEVTAINKNKSSSISTEGYNIMKLN